MRIKSPCITHHTHTRSVLFFRFFFLIFFVDEACALYGATRLLLECSSTNNNFFFRRALFRATYRVATLFFSCFLTIFFLFRRALLRAMCMLLGVLLTSFFFFTGEACSLPSDVYAFGVLLNELFSREIPFGGLTELSDIRYGDLKALHYLNLCA